MKGAAAQDACSTCNSASVNQFARTLTTEVNIICVTRMERETDEKDTKNNKTRQSMLMQCAITRDAADDRERNKMYPLHGKLI